MRRLLIRVDVVHPDDRSATRFAPYFEATASILDMNDSHVLAYGESAQQTTAAYAAENAMNALSLRCTDKAPNGPMCHHPVSCTLAGTCLKQQGGGTACNE